MNRLFVVASLLWCGLASSTGQSGQSGLSEKITADVGQTVILPCKTSVSRELPAVEWSKENLDPNITFLYRDGCETFEMKNAFVQYRTNLFMDQLQNGNISLMISNVQLKDAGKYQCMVLQKKLRKVEKTLELIVGAASEPKLIVVRGQNDGVTLQCEAKCWFPAPELTFNDDQGNDIPAENPKRDQEPSGCFTVTKKATVRTPNTSVTCRVHEPQRNRTWESEIHIPADCMRSCIVPISFAVGELILLLVGLCVGSVFYCLQEKSGQSFWPRKQAGDNQTLTSELQRNIQELQSELHEKDRRIHQLTEDLRSQQGLVLQHSQPTITSGPSTSFPQVSQPVNQAPHQCPHDNNKKPPDSANSSHPKSGNVFKKDAKPGGSRPNPALDPRGQMTNHSGSSLSLFTHKEALLASSSSSSTSDGLLRTRSMSHPHSNVAKSQRRYTISSLSHNRFSVLENLPEDAEMLLSQK